MKLAIAGTLLSALFVTSAIAGPGRHKPISPEVIKKFDANGDGVLDRSERQAMRQARKAEVLAKYDTDGDGILSDSERKALHTDRVIQRFQALDTNGDGVLSFAEFEAGAEKRMMHRKHMMHGKRGHFRGNRGPWHNQDPAPGADVE